MTLKKNSRVDYKQHMGKTYSVLVDFIDNKTLLVNLGGQSLKDIYGEYKFRVKGGMEIDKWRWPFLDYPY